MKHGIRTLIAAISCLAVCNVSADEDLLPAEVSEQFVAGEAATAAGNNETEKLPATGMPLQALSPGKSEQELLAELREVSAPVAPGWWPPAPGWWGLAVILLSLLIYVVRWLRRRWKAQRESDWKKSALSEHQRLSDLAMTKSATPVQIISQASILMRRVSLTQLPRAQVASVTDDQWLAALDRLGKTREYSEGVGQLLTRHPYMRNHDVDYGVVNDLLKLMRHTINSSSAALHREGDRRVPELKPVNNEATKVV